MHQAVHPLLSPDRKFGKRPAAKSADALESAIVWLCDQMEKQDRSKPKGAAVWAVLNSMRADNQRQLDQIAARNTIRFGRPRHFQMAIGAR